MRCQLATGSKAKSGKFNKVMLILAPLLVIALVICVYKFISIQVEIVILSHCNLWVRKMFGSL